MTQEEKSIPYLQVNMLGGLRLEKDGDVLSDDDNRSQKMWSVLAYFIIHQERPISQQELFQEFWHEKNVTNPQSALKTILYRLRPMLTPFTPAGESPIVALRGAYIWNKKIPCRLDLDEFTALSEQAKSPSMEPERRLECCRKALALYKGKLLPKQEGQSWVDTLSGQYHKAFADLVALYFSLTEREERYDEMERLCLHACGVDPLNEQFHIFYIRCLLYLNRGGDALDEYEKAVSILYRRLGTAPSEELRQVYAEVRNAEQGAQNNLREIQSNLRESAAHDGAFLCEYSFLRELYRLEARRAQRSGTSIHLALLTVSLPGGKEPELNHLNNTMDHLLPVVQRSLRSGDVVSRYSHAQYVIMLPEADFKASVMVMDRILSAFRRQYRHNNLKLSYRILDPNEEV